MRRELRTLIFIAVVATFAGLVLGFQTISLGNFERGGDTPLGLKLGLDLQGGSHLVYQARDNETGEPIVPPPEAMEALKRSIEKRVNASGLGEPIIQLLGEDRILIQLPGVEDLERAKSLIGETAQLVFKHRRLNTARPLEEIAGSDIVAVFAGTVPGATPGTPVAPVAPEAAATSSAEETEAQAPEGPPAVLIEFTDAGAQRFADVVARLNDSLIEAITGGSAPPGRLEVAIAGDRSIRFDANALSIQRVEESNQFSFVVPVDNETLATSSVESLQALLGDSPTVEFTEVLGFTDDDIGLTGEDLDRAYASTQDASGFPVVNIEFNARGTRIFGELTSEIAGTSDSIAIFLDGEELISPIVQSAITSGTAIIQGNFTLARVRDLSLLLEAGSLPVSIGDPIQERDVDAILGAESLSKSVSAGLIGLALVLVFMTLYYRVPGVVASIALIFYMAIVLAIFKVLPITLTLSGVGAVILSVGMAVDANILIFERTKDELRLGRTLRSAINNGFDRAWPAIRDSNVSTLITCGILFYFSNQLGTTVVQGFAVALAVGVAVSMFSAIVVSRTLLRAVAATPLAHKLNWFVPSGGAELPQLQQAAPAAQRS
ncbi:MAG: protein translocase subunit SecD [Chloroflexi bacterium]|nr:protein translocase subunit SecD [Chloroflexota bacterium]